MKNQKVSLFIQNAKGQFKVANLDPEVEAMTQAKEFRRDQFIQAFEAWKNDSKRSSADATVGNVGKDSLGEADFGVETPYTTSTVHPAYAFERWHQNIVNLRAKADKAGCMLSVVSVPTHGGADWFYQFAKPAKSERKPAKQSKASVKPEAKPEVVNVTVQPAS